MYWASIRIYIMFISDVFSTLETVKHYSNNYEW